MKIICTDYQGREHEVEEADLVDRTSIYGVLVKQDEILLVNEPGRLYWGLPGGGLEQGESLEEALKREFTEETGLTITGQTTPITDWTEFYFSQSLQQGWRSHRYFYTVAAAEGQLLRDGNNFDTAAARFVPLSELTQTEIKANVRQVIQQALGSGQL